MKVKNLIVVLGLFFSISANAGVSDFFYEMTAKVVGEDKANSIFGRELVVVEPVQVQLPEIPKIEKKNSDASISTPESWLKQSSDFDKLAGNQKRKFELAFLRELFWATRKAAPTDQDLNTWINVLEQGGSREGVYRALVLDEVYSTLEDYEEVPTQAAIEFAKSYSQKFLRLEFKDEILKKMNIFLIKRLITEKTLEIVEILEQKPDDLLRWYAVFSSDMAKSGIGVYQSKIRLEQDSNIQLAWAKKVPLQHIKSEIILKLHFLFNTLK